MPTMVVFPLFPKLLQIHPEFSSIESKTLILGEERLLKTTKHILVINWREKDSTETTERILSGVWSFNETPEQIEYNEM